MTLSAELQQELIEISFMAAGSIADPGKSPNHPSPPPLYKRVETLVEILGDKRVYLTPSPSVSVDLGEVVPLIEAITTGKDEASLINCLCRDTTQTFVNVIHEVLDLPGLPPRFRRKCLSALC
ncbi:hypothetical protein BDM02DRAFT_3130162 [Thelephora ganbajun]|uniref:Uncharacterized protein n=1 Tax=Thelephora ganbajun TaxID=370292 RepID=A0ACB6ZAR0_THEGA|nr:hypothetical protein BDM02DRAFT_3130162 [Thelephora ganbajun]